MLGWRSSTGRTGSSGDPGVLPLRLLPGPSPCSSGREHSLEQNWDAWVAKSTSGPAQAGHRNLSCSVKGSDTTSQPTETLPRGSRPGAKGLARPTSIPPTRCFSRLWVTAQAAVSPGSCRGTGRPHYSPCAPHGLGSTPSRSCSPGRAAPLSLSTRTQGGSGGGHRWSNAPLAAVGTWRDAPHPARQGGGSPGTHTGL